MPLAYELHTDDVIVVQEGDVRTVAHTHIDVTITDLSLVRITFTDGQQALVQAETNLMRIHPQALLSTTFSPSPISAHRATSDRTRTVAK